MAGLVGGFAAASLLVVHPTAPTPVARASGEPRFHFVDVAPRLGIDRVLLSAGACVAFLDYDRDGRLDV